MAGGKSTKRVNLRTKIARKQQAQSAAGADASLSSTSTAAAAAAFANSSASPSVVTDALRLADTRRARQQNAPFGHANEDRGAALQIRDALRQRRGRTSRAPATTTTPTSTSASTSARRQPKSDDRTLRRKRQSAKKESKTDGSAMHPAALRRAAVHERRRLLVPPVSAAAARMAVAQEELHLFDKVQTVPAYAADPFAAVMQHLSATMDTLKPQTPDVGRVARD
ncbi:hypothetical protein ABB37_08929 [Leptomonas pyrrhocoris]|uniref:Ribosome biogenesis protein SLX9 n=1 Tax=Leptomonas pyrrhocoris TaxID=157538 RepID=A0A0N0DRU0_LEPPY|nr:hypothetical protein ABB37_08929 [Leptomonas pyrrhocoris]KPA74961.1 hypothetical protein ABB37_08929 [Leptomonas pyrrhocoris]|eukprot:XP_015653400.1 hypothetical protein ABB37_08929 [Leptomonas pyrrhocoris]